MICPRPDHWHVMAGPIVVRGQLVGAVGVANLLLGYNCYKIQ
jgi:hypothetical protein